MLNRSRLCLGAAALALMASLATPAFAQAPPPALTIGAPGPSFRLNVQNPNVQTTVFGSERGLNIPFIGIANLQPQVRPGNPANSPIVPVFFSYLPDSGPASLPPLFGTAVGCVISWEATGYRSFEIVVTNTVTVGGGITATVRAGGRQLSTATATTSAAAQAQALAGVGALALPGRRLPAIVTASGVTESVSQTSASVLTARDTYIAKGTVTFGPEQVPAGALGRCTITPDLTCEGGFTVNLGLNDTGVMVLTLQDLYFTTTLTRTVTAFGTITLDIPLAADGRGHAGVQTVGFDLSQRFLGRMLQAGGSWGARDAGQWSLFLEGTAERLDYDRDGLVAASDARSEGVRGGGCVSRRPRSGGRRGRRVRGMGVDACRSSASGKCRRRPLEARWLR